MKEQFSVNRGYRGYCPAKDVLASNSKEFLEDNEGEFGRSRTRWFRIGKELGWKGTRAQK